MHLLSIALCRLMLIWSTLNKTYPEQTYPISPSTAKKLILSPLPQWKTDPISPVTAKMTTQWYVVYIWSHKLAECLREFIAIDRLHMLDRYHTFVLHLSSAINSLSLWILHKHAGCHCVSDYISYHCAGRRGFFFFFWKWRCKLLARYYIFWYNLYQQGFFPQKIRVPFTRPAISHPPSLT